MRLDDSVCRACPVGRAHRAGKEPACWPDGTPIERFDLMPLGTLGREAPKK